MTHHWFRWGGRCSRGARRRRPGRAPLALRLEVLEARTVLSFATGVQYPAGSGPNYPEVLDTRGNGIQDIAVTDFNGNAVSVLLGNGDGTFGPPTSYAVGAGPGGIWNTDMNGDGIPDIETANYLGNSVSVLLGNGDGTFKPAINTPVSGGPFSLRVGDYNNDGIPDIITGNYPSSTVTVLLGNGDGTFQSAGSLSTGANPVAIEGDDFNRDGNLDFATANQSANTISVFLGNGDGTFQARHDYATGGDFANGIEHQDFNRDGYPDLVVGNTISNTVSVFLNNGDGTFGSPEIIPVAGGPTQPVAADFNIDGNPDFAVANQGNNTVSVFLGNGDGTFQPPLTLPTGGSLPFDVAAGDLNGDGYPDLVAANYNSGTVTVFLNNADWGQMGGELIVNGGFETGDFSGWDHFGNTSYDSVNTLLPHSGSYAAQVGPVGTLGYLAQTVPTTPGQAYTLTFWLAHPYASSTPNEFQVTIGGNVVYDQTDLPYSDYTEYTFAYTATSTATTVQFGYREDPAYFFLDDVSFHSGPAPGAAGHSPHPVPLNPSPVAVPPAPAPHLPVKADLSALTVGSLASAVALGHPDPVGVSLGATIGAGSAVSSNGGVVMATGQAAPAPAELDRGSPLHAATASGQAGLDTGLAALLGQDALQTIGPV